MTVDPRVPEKLHPSAICPECKGEGKLYAPERLGEEGVSMHDLVLPVRVLWWHGREEGAMSDKPNLRLPRRAKPSKVLSRSMIRPALTRAHVIQPNGHRELLATDSYKLVRFPVGDDIPLGPVSPEALKRIEKGEKHTIEENGAFRFVGADGSPVEYLAPEQDDLFKKSEPPKFEPKKRQVVTLALNAAFLKDVADALGTNELQLEVAVEENNYAAPSAIRVTPASRLDERTEALLMPLRHRPRAKPEETSA